MVENQVVTGIEEIALDYAFALKISKKDLIFNS